MSRAQSSTARLAEPARKFRIMPVPFMIEIGHDAATWQERSGWVSIAERVEEGLSNPEMAAKLLLSQRKPGARSRIDITREPALRGAASR